MNKLLFAVLLTLSSTAQAAFLSGSVDIQVQCVTCQQPPALQARIDFVDTPFDLDQTLAINNVMTQPGETRRYLDIMARNPADDLMELLFVMNWSASGEGAGIEQIIHHVTTVSGDPINGGTHRLPGDAPLTETRMIPVTLAGQSLAMFNADIRASLQAVPEPAPLALLAVGLLGLGIQRWRTS